MTKKKFALLMTSLTIIASLVACSSPVDLSLTNPRMALDAAGAEVTTAYSPSSDFYAVADLYNAPGGTKVHAKWYAVEVDGYDPGSLLDEMTVTIEEDAYTGYVSFKYSYDDPGNWPSGAYKVELYLNDELMHTLDFGVE